MKLPMVCVVYVVTLCIKVSSSSEKTAEEALTSCLNMLQYQRDNNGWFGIVQVQSSNTTKTLQLELSLSLPGRLPSQYVGSVELYRTKNETVSQIKTNQPVQYRIHFPLQNVLPKLDQISVNGEVRCTEPPESGSVVTHIRLTSTLLLDPPNRVFGHAIEQQQNDTGVLQKPTVTSPITICGTHKHDTVLSSQTVTSAEMKWPWLAAIYVQKSTGPLFQCRGTLVSERIVVTAASCFRTTNGTSVTADEVMIFLGRRNIMELMESGAKMAKVKKVVIHSDYMGTEGRNDANIAIAVLQEKVEFTDNIRPICLWEGGNSLTEIVGQWGTVAGWGSDVTSKPLNVKLPIVSEVDCLRSSAIFRDTTSGRTFCAGSRNGMGPCMGDEGSGMMLNVNSKWTLRGIVSFIPTDPITRSCDLSEYAVFTDAGKFVPWIKSFIYSEVY